MNKLLQFNDNQAYYACYSSAFYEGCSHKISAVAAVIRPPEQIDQGAADPDWDKLLTRNAGWFGGDGIFAIPMDGAEYRPASAKTKSLFIFSDSVVADTVGETIQRKDFEMVHNCVAYLDGSEPDPSKFKFFINKDKDGKPTSLFVPNTPNTKKGEYYWLGDGFVNVEMDSTLYIFAYPVIDTIIPGSFFEFDQTGVNIIAIPKGSKPPFKEQRQLETPFFFPLENWNKVTMGSGILVNTTWAGAPKPDGYIYIMGAGGTNNGLVIARVKPKEFEQFDKWEFAAGRNWTTDYRKTTPVTRFVSNEMSLSPMADGRFILAHQFFGMENEVAVANFKKSRRAPISHCGKSGTARSGRPISITLPTTPKASRTFPSPANCSSPTTSIPWISGTIFQKSQGFAGHGFLG